MSYDLCARNKKLKEFRVGAFMWPIMMQETGAGYVIGYGAGRSPATCVYVPDKRGAGPHSNDGYRVTGQQAKAMSAVIKGFVSVNRFINKEWETIPNAEEVRKTTTYNGKPLYNPGFPEIRLQQFEEFANWAEQSQGFTIN